MRLVETTSRIRFHGLRFWFLRLVELAFGSGGHGMHVQLRLCC